MADPVVANVFKSGAILWYAPVGETIPDKDTIGAGDPWGGNWQRLGFTKAPVTFAYEREVADINVEEYLAPIDKYRIAEKAQAETTLAELTADYLSLGVGGTPTEAAAGAGTVGYEELEVGGEFRLTKYAVGFEGIRYDANDNDLPLRLFMYRAVITLNGELEFSKRSDDFPGLPIVIELLADTDNNGKLFKFQRVTAPAT